MPVSMLLEEELPATEPVLAAETSEPEVAVAVPEVAPEAAAAPPVAPPSPDLRAAAIAAVQNARDLPPGVRERLQAIVQQAVTLDVAGEPLLATRQVLDLLAQGLPSVLRNEATEIERPVHPQGDAFFALAGEDITDQQAEQIAKQQLERAGMLRAA